MSDRPPAAIPANALPHRTFGRQRHAAGADHNAAEVGSMRWPSPITTCRRRSNYTWSTARPSQVSPMPRGAAATCAGYEFSCDTHVDDVHICATASTGSIPTWRPRWGAKRSKSEAYEELCCRLTARGIAPGLGKHVLRFYSPRRRRRRARPR